MKIANSTLSFVRHLLTSVGSILAATSPDPTTKLIAAAVASAAASWGISDEYRSENTPSQTPPPPTTPPTGAVSAVALVVAGLLAVGSSLSFVGCATSSTSTTTDKEAAITAGVLNLAGTSIAPVLKNNPSYITVAQAIYDGLGAISTEKIDAKTIAEWISVIGVQKKWDAAQVAYAQTLATSAWSIYTSTSGEPSAAITDPKIKSWIAAFRSGLGNAIAIAEAK